MIYLSKTPDSVKKLFPRYTWNIPTNEKVVYLTFDDGPTTGVTEWVLDTLGQYNAKATFFCVGEAMQANPEIVEMILSEDHRIGNHTMRHLNGRKTADTEYLEDIEKCTAIHASDIFRPPYGMIKKSQSTVVLDSMDIVMWDVLSGDFDKNVSNEKCASNVLDNVRPGSIVVFHDSQKAEEKMKFALNQTLEKLSTVGYQFEVIPNLR